jgi:hypothetical protein
LRQEEPVVEIYMHTEALLAKMGCNTRSNPRKDKRCCVETKGKDRKTVYLHGRKSKTKVFVTRRVHRGMKIGIRQVD